MIVGAIGSIAAAFSAGGVFAAGGALAAVAAIAGPLLAVVAAMIAVAIAVKMLMPFLKQLGQIFVLLFGDAIMAAVTAARQLVSLVAIAWQQVIATAATAARQIAEIVLLSFAKLGEQIVNLFKAAIETVKNSVLSLADTASNAFAKASQATGSTASVWKQNFSMLGEIVNLGVQKVVNYLMNLRQKIADMGGLGHVMVEVGKQIIAGLINGIGSMISSLVQKVKEMASKASNAVKGAFGIHSPSQLMMKYGEQVVAGFNKGIDSFGGIGVTTPPMRNGSSSMPTVGAPALAGAGNVYIENLTVPPGTTREQIDFIMNAIAKEFKRNGGIG
jgi:phage-related protein